VAAKCSLFAHAHDRERLTGESSKQKVALWHIALFLTPNVPDDVATAKVLTIGAICVRIPLARENALSPRGLETRPHSADSSE
jgi:hypothetical protein